jgi:O-antigen/teichoic acid export membrane protein
MLAAAVGVSSAVGLPDRVLQGVGRARTVEKMAATTAAFVVITGLILIPPFGLAGAATVRLIAMASVNIAMLLSTKPRNATTGYSTLVVASVASSVLAAWSGARSSYLLTAVVAVVGLLAVLAVGARAVRGAAPTPSQGVSITVPLP